MRDEDGRLSRVERVHRQLLQLIDDRGLRAGDKLPSETALSEQFAVSRPTVREALKLLDQEGIVTPVTGHGRYLTAARTVRVERPITRYEGLTRMLEALGYTVTTSVVSVEQSVASDRVAEQLDIAPGAPIVRVSRLKLGDGAPLVYSVSSIRRDALPESIDAIDWTGSLVASLAAVGHPIVASAASIAAAELPVGDARSLGLAGVGPWLLVKESCVTESGERVLYSEDYHRGDAISFNVERHR